MDVGLRPKKWPNPTYRLTDSEKKAKGKERGNKVFLLTPNSLLFPFHFKLFTFILMTQQHQMTEQHHTTKEKEIVYLQPAYPCDDKDDEIDLLDLWNVLWRGKWLIAVVVSAAVLVAGYI